MVKVSITAWKNDTIVDLTTMPLLKDDDRIDLRIKYEYDDGFKYEDKIEVHCGDELAWCFYYFYTEGFF